VEKASFVLTGAAHEAATITFLHRMIASTSFKYDLHKEQEPSPESIRDRVER